MSGAFLDRNSNDQLLFKSTNRGSVTNGTEGSLKRHYHPVYRTSTVPSATAPSAVTLRSRAATTGQSIVMATKDFLLPPSRHAKPQSATCIPRRLAPSHPHPKTVVTQDSTSSDMQKRHPYPHAQLIPIPRLTEPPAEHPLQYPEASVAMNHWQEMLEPDRNVDSLPPSVLKKVQKNPASPYPAKGRFRRVETPPSRKLSLDMHTDHGTSPSVNLTFCAGAATTVLTEDPPGVASPLSTPQYDEHLLNSNEPEHSQVQRGPHGGDPRLTRNQSVEEMNTQHNGAQQLIVEEGEEDYPLFQSTQVVTPSTLSPPKLMYQMPSQLVATGAGGQGGKASVPYPQSGQNSNYKEYRPSCKGSKATAQTIQGVTSPWDPYVLFSSDETAILIEARRILFEGIRVHSQIAAECDCTTPIREKALDDLRKSLSVIQALPPLASNCFVVE